LGPTIKVSFKPPPKWCIYLFILLSNKGPKGLLQVARKYNIIQCIHSYLRVHITHIYIHYHIHTLSYCVFGVEQLKTLASGAVWTHQPMTEPASRISLLSIVVCLTERPAYKDIVIGWAVLVFTYLIVRRRDIRSALCITYHKTTADTVTEADDKLFSLILHNKYHALHSLLPDCTDFKYNLTPRRHSLALTTKASSITDRNLITRIIFKYIYWFTVHTYIYVYTQFSYFYLLYVCLFLHIVYLISILFRLM